MPLLVILYEQLFQCVTNIHTCAIHINAQELLAD